MSKILYFLEIFDQTKWFLAATFRPESSSSLTSPTPPSREWSSHIKANSVRIFYNTFDQNEQRAKRFRTTLNWKFLKCIFIRISRVVGKGRRWALGYPVFYGWHERPGPVHPFKVCSVHLRDWATAKSFAVRSTKRRQRAKVRIYSFERKVLSENFGKIYLTLLLSKICMFMMFQQQRIFFWSEVHCPRKNWANSRALRAT